MSKISSSTVHKTPYTSGSDLIVMTTHGRGPVSRFWLGSVADQLVHRLPMPLLLIRTQEDSPLPRDEPELRNLLVALDGTPTAEQILQPAGVLAKLMGASCTLLRVVPAEVSSTANTERAVDAPWPTNCGLRHVSIYNGWQVHCTIRESPH
jgi:nucleotide-binding universal stress UspA family protein